ncbi:MAG: GNAT family N-acetyltransferase [candidate division Zixibacteria bacterium]|nr:GNAT family N-acetyltransferase [candidate division Zixibacteria bacterium]
MAREIKALTIEHYDDIIRVWSDAGLPFKPNGRESRAMVAAEMSRAFCRYYGLFDNGRLIGVSIANYDGRRGWINRLAIDPDYRGRGLAHELMTACEDFLHTFGEILVCALIEEDNTPSMACFDNKGYVCMREITYWSKRDRPDL